MQDIFVRVPPGAAQEVLLVDRRTGSEWTVAVEPFEIASTVVTVEHWNKFARQMSDTTSDSGFPLVEVSWREAIDFCNEMSHHAGLTPAYLVEVVDPDQATGWVPHDRPAADDRQVTWNREADGYRLPTEAEWQLACRAGTTGPHYGSLDSIAWFTDNSDGHRHEVAGKDANTWGLFDMLGGVWEWCWDLFDPDVYGSYRVIRGGGWADPAWTCRAGVRRKTHPTARFDDLGFRVARNLTETIRAPLSG